MRVVWSISLKRKCQLKLKKTVRVLRMKQKNTFLIVKLKVNQSFIRWQLQKMENFWWGFIIKIKKKAKKMN